MRTAKDNLWLDMEFDTGPTLSGEQETDVAIVGGGFSGLSSAYFIKRRYPDKRIIVLESEFVGYGASGRNTGIAGATLAHSMHRLQKIHGTAQIGLLQDISLRSFRLVEDLIQKNNIDCDYERTGLLIVAENDKQVSTLKKEAETCDAVGEKAILLDAEEARNRFGAINARAGLYHPEQGTLNPAKLARGMKEVVESLGVEVYEHSRCTDIEPGPVISVYTPIGHVRAKSLVLATNAYDNPLGVLRRKVLPLYVYNIATEPLTKAQLEQFHWPERSIVFNPKHLFWVIRLTADNRVVFIDNDARYFYSQTRDYSHRPREYRSHYRLLVKMFPFLEGIRMTHHWGGRIGINLNYLPCIGCTGKNRNIFYAMGYNGHGVALTQIAGQIIADLMAEETSLLTNNLMVNKPPTSIPSAPISYLGINAYKLVYKIDDWLSDRST